MAYFGCINKSSSPPTPPEPNYLYKWDFTKTVDPLVDEIQGAAITLRSGAQISNNGVSFTERGHCIVLPTLSENFFIDKVIELDIAKFDFKGNERTDINFFVVPNDTNYADTCILCWMNNTQWSVWGATSTSGTGRRASSSFNSNLNRNSFDDKTIKLTTKRPTSGYDIFKLYIDDELVGTVNDIYIPKIASGNRATIGSRYGGNGNGDQSYDCIISGIRIYENEEV